MINWFGGTFGWIWLLIVMLPIYWIVITSFKTQSSYFVTNTFAPPTEPTIENYKTVLDNSFVRYFLNSVIVSVATGLVSGFAPAWSASRLDPVAALRYE